MTPSFDALVANVARTKRRAERIGAHSIVVQQLLNVTERVHVEAVQVLDRAIADACRVPSGIVRKSRKQQSANLELVSVSNVELHR